MDAMTLATMVAEPETFGKEDLDRWVRVIDYSTIANQFAKYVVARSAPAPWAVTKWTKAKRPFVAIAGWDVVSCLAMEEDGARWICSNYWDVSKRRSPDRLIRSSTP
ncbi:MAG: hypothetical protein VX255_13015 [Candidatus Latescibacterota bacterium]|nr:hypothetical protein [Candidatus Latescibacterota bacterium]